MTARETAATIDDYIAGFPPETQALLEQVRAICREEAPGATETISYAIPTFDLQGRHLCHFAGFKHHLGFYPTDRGASAFADEFRAYKGGQRLRPVPLQGPAAGGPRPAHGALPRRAGHGGGEVARRRVESGPG